MIRGGFLGAEDRRHLIAWARVSGMGARAPSKSLLSWAEGRDLRSLRSGQPRPGRCKVVQLVR
jgi:hypothetical protein